MKAIVIENYGDTHQLVLQDMPKPEVKAGHALLKIKAIGVNFIDIYMRRGEPFISIPLPFIPGVEAAGVVEAIGEGVTEVVPGDRVAYFGVLGSYAEYNSVKASQLIPLPENMSFEMGAAFPLQGMTAEYLMNDCYPIKLTDTILVHAAAGGVGLICVQWLKKLGAKIIGTVSTEEKAKIVYEAGADHVIIYTKQDFVEEVNRLTEGKGVDYIIDGVGKETFTKDLAAIKTRGTICLFGMSSGEAEPFSPNSLQNKSITLCGGNLMNYVNSREELLRRANNLLQGIAENWLKIKIDHIFPMEKAELAQKLLEERKAIGKIVLKIGE